MTAWLWYFLIYSFLGFCLEVAYAWAVRCPKRDRKCFLLLPLCPVYGVGALLILAPAGALAPHPLLAALWSGLASTAAEYGVSLLYEKALGVSFWDYSHFPWNLRGRVCLHFSLSWCVLGLLVVYFLHPVVAGLSNHLPFWLLWALVSLLAVDSVLTVAVLRRTGDTSALMWYRTPPVDRAGRENHTA